MTNQTLDAQRVRSIVDVMRREDLSRIDSRVLRETGGSVDLPALKEEALRFLGLAAVSQESISPSKSVDTYWHSAVLHTREYQRLCAVVGDTLHGRAEGYFIHHNPGKPDVRKYQRTLELYNAVFGKPNQKFWNSKIGGCDSDGESGGGDSGSDNTPACSCDAGYG